MYVASGGVDLSLQKRYAPFMPPASIVWGLCPCSDTNEGRAAGEFRNSSGWSCRLGLICILVCFSWWTEYPQDDLSSFISEVCWLLEKKTKMAKDSRSSSLSHEMLLYVSEKGNTTFETQQNWQKQKIKPQTISWKTKLVKLSYIMQVHRVKDKILNNMPE